MRLTELSLTASPVNTACDEILAHLDTVTDNNGQKLFQSVGRGIWIPKDIPTGDTSPALRIWYESANYDIESVQFFTGKREVTFSLAIYVWSPLVDSDGVAVDIMQRLADLADTTLAALQYVDATDVGFNWSHFWSPVTDQTVRLDFTNRLARFNNNQPLEPPWYVVTLTFRADVFNA